MDPTSALGAVAASAQFLGYGIKGLVYAAQLLRDIKGAPEDSLRIVTRLEKEITSMNRLLSSDSSIFSQLTTAQYVHIAPWALEARKALDEANKILSPLSTHLDQLKGQDGARKRVLRSWKSLLTTKAMRDVEKQMETIQMLNISLIRELNVAGFESQYLLREQGAEVLDKITEVTRATTALQQSMSDLSSQYDKASEMLMTSSAAVANGLEILDQANGQRQVSLVQAISTMNNEISAVRTGLEMVDKSSRALNTSIEQSRTDVTDQNILLATQLRKFIRVQGDKNQDILIGKIKNLLITELMGTVHHFAVDHRKSIKTKDYMSQSDVVAQGTSIGQTTRSPGFVRCSCKRGRVSSSNRYGWLSIRISHQNSQVCPLHGRIAQHELSVVTKLSPWLNSALELTLGVLCSNSSWSILPSLRFRGTVKRSESPIYRLFDIYFADCRDLSFPDARSYWSEPDIEEHLLDLVSSIKNSVLAGEAYYDDLDEYGSNLLIETTHLMGSMYDMVIYHADAVHKLLEMARNAQVDPTMNMFAQGRFFPDGSDLLYPPTTVCEYIYQEGLFNFFRGTSIYNTIVEYDGMAESVRIRDCQIEGFHQQLGYSYSIQPSNMIDWAIMDPEFATAAGYSHPLQEAVLRRSLDDLKKYFRHDQKFKGRSSRSLHLLSMAVGWPEGLQYLIQHQDHLDLFALEYAVMKQEFRSVEIILSAGSKKLFTSEYLILSDEGHLYPTLTWHSEGDFSCFRKAVNELWSRMDDLRHILLNLFRTGFGSSKSKRNTEARHLIILNYDFYHLLREKSRNPYRLEELDPFITASLHYGPYAVGVSREYHQIVYEAGFVQIDVACGEIGTPLAHLCQRLLKEQWMWKDRQWHSAVWWFLSKGANPDFWFWKGSETTRRWSHLQFYVAANMAVGYCSSPEILANCGQEYVQDGCVCPCSSQGCIPPFKLWRECEPIADHSDHEHCQNRLGRRWTDLTNWMKLLNYSKSRKEYTYRELCRLELFDRLGMKHSCCMRSFRGFDDSLREGSGDSEHFRREDVMSKRQLELLMSFYNIIRRILFDQPVQRFWSIWWAVADMVVLPFQPTEACAWPKWHLEFEGDTRYRHKRVPNLRNRLANTRDDRWTALLEAHGYKEWDYEDVIKHHFTQLCLRAKAHKERKRSWKQHRLMLKPKFVDQGRRNTLQHRADNKWE